MNEEERTPPKRPCAIVRGFPMTAWYERKWLDLNEGDVFLRKYDGPSELCVVDYYDDVDVPGQRLVVFHVSGDSGHHYGRTVARSSDETVLVLNKREAAEAIVASALQTMGGRDE